MSRDAATSSPPESPGDPAAAPADPRPLTPSAPDDGGDTGAAPAERPRFSPRERRILEALFARALPPSPRLPATAADLGLVEQVEAFFADMPSYSFSGYRTMLWALERGALLRRLRPFSRLRPEQQDAYLRSLHHSRFPHSRLLLKLTLTILKLVRYDLDDVVSSFDLKVEAPRPPGRRVPQGVFGEAVVDTRSLAREQRIDAEVVVVGTGAGGAVVGKELAELGRQVVFLEEGDYYTRVDFNRRAVQMSRLLYRDAGLVAALGRPGVLLPLGRAVGGTTTINSGTCFRIPDPVLAKWREEQGLPFTSEMLAPYYEKVEQTLHVAPVAAEVLGNVARVIARGADALGYRHGPLSRNAKECRGSGVCAFGCPTDAKQSMQLSYVPRALAAGARLYTGARAERLLVEDGRVLGVVARTRGGGRLVVRSEKVVVACGSLYTPALLRRNGLCGRSGALGRNLTIHPATKAMALFPEKIRGWEGVPQGYQIDHFKDEGMLYEGAMVPPSFGAIGLSLFGPRFSEVMDRYDHMAVFGFLVADTSRGRVRLGPAGRPVVVYNLHPNDRQKIVRGLGILARVFFAAGAEAVFPAVHGFDELRSLEDVERFEGARVSPWDLDLAAFHPLGTARMGTDPATTVVGPDCQTHEVRGLYVVDGSIFPTSLGVNPQLTIMAFATHAAREIAGAH